MNAILSSYGELLQEVDDWFAACIKMYPENVNCKAGCSDCCRGLFDITVLDAMYLKQGFEKLEFSVRIALQKQAKARLSHCSSINQNFKEPWFLNQLSDSEQDELMPENDMTPCLLLSDNKECLVYQYRPMTCRLHGIPLFDIDGEPFSDEHCSLNFKDVNSELLLEIRHNFRSLFIQELDLFRQFTNKLYGYPLNEHDTIIPAAILS